MADFTIQEEFSKELSVTKTNAGLVSGFTVLEAARARLPEEVHIVNLSGGDFEGFEEEDLEFFSNLKVSQQRHIYRESLRLRGAYACALVIVEGRPRAQQIQR